MTETDRLLLRRWRDEDLDTYARICADPEVMRYVTGTPLTRERCGAQIARFERGWEEMGFGMWAAEERATGAWGRGLVSEGASQPALRFRGARTGAHHQHCGSRERRLAAG